MNKIISFIVLFFLFGTKLHAQTYQWVAQEGGTDYETGEDIAIDAAGNVYMAGIFNSTADFDPGPGVFNLTSAGAQDVYVVKLDAAKNFIWAVKVGGTQQDFAYALRVYNGSVYVAGYFRGTVDFNPGPGVDSLVSAGGEDIFVLKLDTASSFVWVKQIGGATNDVAEKMTMDDSGNILVCGQFEGTVDFDPGPGVQNIVSASTADAYILKLDSGGSYTWAGHFGNNQGQIASDIVTDASGDIYLTGEFYGTTDFDPGNNVFNMSTTGFNGNIFVLKWTSAGNFVWAVNMGNSSGGDQGIVIEVDQSGNPIVAGSYFGTVDFDPGPNVYNLSAVGTGTDIFLLKLSSSNGSLLFAKSMGGPSYEQPYAIDLNADGDIFIGGFFSSTADFDPDAGVYNLTGNGLASDIFLTQYDTSGQLIWAAGLGSTDTDFMRGLTCHGNDVYCSGVFAFTVDFDPGAGIDTLNSFSNSSDAFLLKMGFCATVQSGQVVSLCPGDSIFAGGNFQLLPGIYVDSLTSSMGCDSIVTSTVQYTYLLDIGSDIDTCEGTPVVLDAVIPGALYLWDTGDTTKTIQADTAGMYSVTVSYNGCIQHDSITVNFNPLPSIDLGNDTTICINNPLIIDAGPGFAGYIWQDGSSGQAYTLSGTLPVGAYSVSVTVFDANGCLNSDSITVFISSCAGISDPGVMEAAVYPQPAADHVIIKAGEIIKEVRIFTMEGKELKKLSFENGKNKAEILTGSLENGIYFLEIKSGYVTEIVKLVIQH
jgi:hypothetical protein